MKITLKKNGWKIPIWIPNFLIFNKVTAGLVIEETEDSKLKREQFLEIKRIIKQYKKNHPDWVFVEVESKDGEYVKVTL